jgi:hypothetical protein
MDKIRIFLFFFFVFSVNQFINAGFPEGDKNEQAFVISLGPVNTFLNVKMVKSGFLQSEDTLKNPLKIEVKVINKKRIMVFSATKNVYEFDIYTGGLPDGSYTIFCKVYHQQFQKDFEVKH